MHNCSLKTPPVQVVLGMPTPHDLGVHRLLSPLKPLRKLFDYPSQRRLAAAINISDLRQCASSRAHKMVFDYIDGAADDEITLNRNRDAYSELEMRYSVLAGHDEVDLSTSLFGRQLRLPFFCAPTAGQRMFHHEGEEAAARVCSEEQTLFCLSALGTTGLDEVAAINPSGAKCLQLYLWKDRELMRDVLQRAKEAGFHSIALTGDTAVFGNRERDPRNGFTVPPNYSPYQAYRAALAPAWTFDFLSNEPFYYKVSGHGQTADSLTAYFSSMMSKDYSWRDAEWLLGEWGGAAALKGVATPADARRAVELGFTCVWVSNHGGRQLDTSPPTIELLPELRGELGDAVELVLDGGIMRGTDIAKALALGADGVGVGRAYLYGLAAGGTAGVRKAVAILKSELMRSMFLLGVSSVDDLRKRGPDLIRRRRR